MQAESIKIITPKKIILNGFIFGPKRTKIIYIFLHGLSGNLFSRIELADKLSTSGAAALVFNNRGHGLINKFRKINPRRPNDFQVEVMGEVHEVFEDCIDDIDGAINTALEKGYKKIVLVGHSTGCNKISYYLSKKSPDAVLGGILLAPMSDYADARNNFTAEVLHKATVEAEKLVSLGKPHELFSLELWPDLIDAQRFLSLYTPESKEEIFSYALQSKKPVVLKKISKPLLVALAEEDEFADRPMREILNWFKETLVGKAAEIIMIKKSIHSFKGHESKLRKIILDWVKNI